MRDMARHPGAWAVGLLAATLMTGCGGGGGGGGEAGGNIPTPPPASATAIPDNLAISSPEATEAGDIFQFTASGAGLTGLKFEWNFGDGATSSLASPTHAYAAGGEFDVTLKVSNAGGASREVRSQVKVTTHGNVRGLECSGEGQTGWCWQSPRPMGNEVTAVRFIDANTGWRGGGAGDIFSTKDGGKTWHRQRMASSAAIKDFLFRDRSWGLVYTFEGELFRTADGGATWVRCDISGVKDVGLTRDGVAFASTTGGSQRSEDGGLTWSKVAMSVRARSSGSVFWNAEDGVLYRSQDGGKSAQVVLRVPNTSGSLILADWLVPVTEQHLVYIAAKQTYLPNHTLPIYVAHVYTTKDGGQSWSMTEAAGLPERPDRIFAFGAMSDGRVLTANNGQPWLSLDGGKTWSAAVPPNVLAMGVIASSTMGDSLIVNFVGRAAYVTDDFGQSWQKLRLPDVLSDRIEFIGNGVLELTDYLGNKYVSENRGASWSQVHATPFWNPDSSLVSFRDAKNGYMFRNGKRDLNSDQMLSTTDGGQTWSKFGEPFFMVHSLQFTSADVGWMLAGLPAELFKTMDGGKTWTPAAADARSSEVQGIRFDSPRLGWMVRPESHAVTTDGGQSWQNITMPAGMTSLAMSDESWVASGWDGVRARAVVTRDQGKTWTASNLQSDEGMLLRPIGKKVFWAGNLNHAMRSEDGGSTWVEVSAPMPDPAPGRYIRDIAFANADVGWLVGDGGMVFATRDAGRSWKVQLSGTHRSLRTIQAMDAKTAWISGEYGTVLATSTGGD